MCNTPKPLKSQDTRVFKRLKKRRESGRKRTVAKRVARMKKVAKSWK